MTEKVAIPIAQMGNGFFWTRSRMIVGVSPEEGDALMRGELTLARTVEIQNLCEISRIALRDAPVPGVQEWMTHRRAVS